MKLDKWYEEQYKNVWVHTQVNAPFIFTVDLLRKKWKIKISKIVDISYKEATTHYEKLLADLTAKSDKYIASDETKQYKPLISTISKLNETNAFKQRVIAELMSNAPILRFERDIETFTKIFGFTENWTESFALYIVTNHMMVPSAPSFIEYNMRPIRKNIKQMVDIFYLDIFKRLHNKDGDQYDAIGEIDIAESVYGKVPDELQETKVGKKKEQAELSRLRKDRERFRKDDHFIKLTKKLRKDLIELFS